MSTINTFAPNSVQTINGYQFWVEDSGTPYAIQALNSTIHMWTPPLARSSFRDA